VTTRLEALALRMESTYVRFDLFEAAKQLSEAEHNQIEERVEKLEGRQEWLVRTVGAIVISAVLSVIIVSSRLLP
jgi:hypothetical protein